MIPATMEPCRPEAYDLMHYGMLALSQVEANGIQIDLKYLKETKEKLTTTVRECSQRLRSHAHWSKWRKRFGEKTSLGSKDQLGVLLYDILGHEPSHFTDKGKPSTDESALEKIDDDFVRDYVKWTKYEKARGTYLIGIEREVVNGFLHPVFNLHLTRTYRSSSEAPNFQNVPVRNKEISQIVRQCYIPRKNHRIVEIDYGGIEVKIAACYHRDPVVLRDIDEGDMHRDMAAECFICGKEDVNKTLRYVAKNRFVFPQFYGSYWAQCAPSIWEAISLMNLKVGGIPAKEWVKNKGIIGLGAKQKIPAPGTFLSHIKAVERRMWEKRYKIYNKWKFDWFDEYERNGWFETKTGFRISGVMKRNDVINYPVQGSAFHCLLWSLIRIVQEIKKRKMKTKIVGQIHDSIVADVHKDEFEDYLILAKRVMTQTIKKHWKWIITDLEIDAEATPLNMSWFHKEEVPI